jgi:hypothetical protein
VVAGPRCLWCGQQLGTAPIEPNAGGPKLSRVSVSHHRFAAALSSAPHQSVQQSLSVSPFQKIKKSLSLYCFLLAIVLLKNVLLWAHHIPRSHLFQSTLKTAPFLFFFFCGNFSSLPNVTFFPYIWWMPLF